MPKVGEYIYLYAKKQVEENVIGCAIDFGSMTIWDTRECSLGSDYINMT